MARVLVTGSSGFLGSAVVARLLESGHDVTGLDPAPPLPDAPDHPRIADDLSDPARLRDLLARLRPTHVVHAGGVSGPMVMPDRPGAIMDINVGGTLNLLQAALHAAAGTFVHCSSLSAIGPFDGSEPIGIDHPLRPETAYGCSKAAAELLIQGLWRRVPMELCVLRFTGIYGPGRRTSFLLDDLVAAALERRPARIPSTTPAPYLYGDDAARAVVAACFAPERTQLTYYVAHPELVAVTEVEAIIEEQIGPLAVVVDDTLPPARRGAADLAPTLRDLGFAAQTGIHAGMTRLIAARRAAFQQETSACRM